MKFNEPGQDFHVIAFDELGRVTGQAASITSGLSIDGGARNPLDDANPTEIGTTGEYVFDLLQAETNGHALSFTPVCATPGVQVLGVPSNVIYTFDFGDVSQSGDWAITRTFQIAGGDKVSGVRMSLVGVAGKSATTGSSGIATVKTDDGTYTLRVVVPAGYEDVADTMVTINGADSTATVTLVATTVTPPTNPDKSALEILCLDETGEPEADVAVDIRIAVVPSGDQNIAYKGTKQTATSDVNGVARLEAIKGAVYEYKRGKAEVWNRVTIGSGDTTNVSSFIGSP
jgi:hypothetical protein